MQSRQSSCRRHTTSSSPPESGQGAAPLLRLLCQLQRASPSPSARRPPQHARGQRLQRHLRQAASPSPSARHPLQHRLQQPRRQQEALAPRASRLWQARLSASPRRRHQQQAARQPQMTFLAEAPAASCCVCTRTRGRQAISTRSTRSAAAPSLPDERGTSTSSIHSSSASSRRNGMGGKSQRLRPPHASSSSSSRRRSAARAHLLPTPPPRQATTCCGGQPL